MLQLADDTQSLILAACDFETLQVVLCVSRRLHDSALTTIKSTAWRRRASNEEALQTAAWEDGQLTEGCAGAFRSPFMESVDLDGSLAASCSSDGDIRVWDVESMACTMSARVTPLTPRTVALKGKRLAVATQEGILIYELAGDGDAARKRLDCTVRALTWVTTTSLVALSSSHCYVWHVSECNSSQVSAVDLLSIDAEIIDCQSAERPSWSARESAGLAACGSMVAVRQGRLVFLLSLPELVLVRSLVLEAGPSGWVHPQGSFYHHIALSASHLAVGTDSGEVHVWPIALLVDHLNDQANAVNDGDHSSGEHRVDSACGAGCFTLVDPDHQPIFRRRPNRTMSLVMRGPLLATCSRDQVPRVWDVHSRRLLRIIDLPARSHAHFHRNIVVPHSIEQFGVRLAIDRFRLVLTASIKEGDWTERMQLPRNGGSYMARSIIVTQDAGPEWVMCGE